MKNELNSAKICHIAKFMLIELLDVCTMYIHRAGSTKLMPLILAKETWKERDI